MCVDTRFCLIAWSWFLTCVPVTALSALKKIWRLTYSVNLTFFLLCSWMNKGSSAVSALSWIHGGGGDSGIKSSVEELSLDSVKSASITASIVGETHR